MKIFSIKVSYQIPNRVQHPWDEMRNNYDIIRRNSAPTDNSQSPKIFTPVYVCHELLCCPEEGHLLRQMELDCSDSDKINSVVYSVTWFLHRGQKRCNFLSRFIGSTLSLVTTKPFTWGFFFVWLVIFPTFNHINFFDIFNIMWPDNVIWHSEIWHYWFR